MIMKLDEMFIILHRKAKLKHFLENMRICRLSPIMFLYSFHNWLRSQFMGFICRMPGLPLHVHTIGHVRNPWLLLSSTFTSFIIRGSEWKQSQRGAFLSLNKRPLRQIVLPRLISFGLFFFSWHHMKEFVEEGKHSI